GTTGQPKGIVVNQQNIVKLSQETNDMAILPEDRVMQWANFAFDGSTYEIYNTLLNGATLHLIQSKDAAQPSQLAKIIAEQKISVCFFTTSLFHAFVELELEALQPLRKIIVGGEKMSLAHTQKALATLGPEIIVNGYGPTETTVFAIAHTVTKAELVQIPIGQPLGNTQIYIVDENGAPSGIGVPGEIWIAGDGVSNGYLNREALNQEKFIDNPFTQQGRLYKTGDLGRILSDGTILISGRIDQQVKVRGYRIEPEEIEKTLLAIEAIQQAIVTAPYDSTGVRQLVAYWVGTNGMDQEQIQGTLKQQLPDYMVPSILVRLEQLPLTPNGKVDKKALPDPMQVQREEKIDLAPRTSTEKQVAQIWQDLLEVESIGVYDDFFNLGGHSLLATRVISKIRSQLKVEISIHELFNHTSVEALAHFIDQQEQELALPPLVAQKRPEYVPLSFAQERLWFIDQLEGSVHYHISRAIRIEGTINRTAFEKALIAIINRHELLRTLIKEEQGTAYQEILPTDLWTLQWTDHLQGASRVAIIEYVDQLMAKAFVLSQDHPIRGELIQISEEEHLFVLIMHHIASDAWSFDVFLHELTLLYNAYVAEAEPSLAPLPIQYSDFAIWQRKHQDGAILDQQLAYWKKQLQGLAPIELKTDFPRPALQSFRGNHRSILMNPEISQQLNDLARDKEVTPFMLLLTAFKILLFKYTGQNDLCVGTPIAGRTVKEVESLIGFFVNTLVIRSEVNKNLSFDDLLAQIKKTTLDAFAHQLAPFEKIVETLGVKRDQSRSPIFQVLFAYQNTPNTFENKLTGIQLYHDERASQAIAQRDLSMSIDESPEGLYVGIDYCSDLFLPKTIEQMLLHFGNLLRALLQSEETNLGELNILGQEEKEQILGLTDHPYPYPQQETVLDLFRSQVQKHTSKTAIVFYEENWTYQQLDQGSDRLAQQLIQDFGIQEGDFVGLHTERSPWMIVAILGILKSGAAYIPIDPDYPESRKQFVLEDTQIKVLISTQQSDPSNNFPALEVLVVGADWLTRSTDLSIELPKVQSSAIAYVIYTSGTTGKPKGALLPHRGLYNLVAANPELAYRADCINHDGAVGPLWAFQLFPKYK
ncbi:MAG: condensation domain-containing protein, partial [Bacteroidota bacterium]